MNGLKLTGLWKSKTKDGKTYLSGTLGGIKVLVFTNEYKKRTRTPTTPSSSRRRKRRTGRPPRRQNRTRTSDEWSDEPKLLCKTASRALSMAEKLSQDGASPLFSASITRWWGLHN